MTALSTSDLSIIINYYDHCLYAIYTSRMEGFNNKIKVIKHKAFGFHDVEYFSLIIKDAFAVSN
jgi:transposase